MGERIAQSKFDEKERIAFVQNLIDDVKALEILVDQGLIEDDITRIGAEQEMCLIDNDFRPAGRSMSLLKEIDDPHFTTELASYNIEANLDPFTLTKGCFGKVEKQLLEFLDKAKTKAEKLDMRILLAGILPTISKAEMEMEYMTPIPRYYKINEVLKDWHGDDFRIKIQGVDELSLYHDSVLFEACNTSFQLHLQIPSYDFIKSYNWAQAIAGPVLGVCCNSPYLMGRELWKETRIALFQQSLDTRKWINALREQVPRVGFGQHWQHETVTDIFKEDISTHRIMLTKPITHNSLQILENGAIPKLEALGLFNGTVYRWNRPCYGVGNGKPHLRIENRYIPSGPSVIDEMANFAFWVGLMVGRPEKYDDMSNIMDFREAKLNFIRAAINGRKTVFSWLNQPMPLQKLVLEELLPIAYDGLKKRNVDEKDIERLLGIIEARTKLSSGAEWQVKNYRKLKKQMKPDSAVVQMTKAMYENQQTGLPVHEWPLITETDEIKESFKWVGQIMSTKLLKLQEDDFANLATAIMKWNNIHHLPVENNKGELVGLLTWSHIEDLGKIKNNHNVRVSEIMIKKVVTVRPRTKITTAKKLMADYQIGCLPVCSGSNLVGIISKVDL
ncbi:CBS domain-containing protein [Flagellimonas nanhaiensis]|uniref:CBS domain-containing protein n=1 Tax=Flagellimonas nanhaiensis TaxID=2292706 RepID=A0A371JN90_9FLAO|nr:CBS domain-containing protein [Allomuricauda nanhaiensis]RDY58668.1 CBS domain-containing protein [Allomuricauda nanhaiensis]